MGEALAELRAVRRARRRLLGIPAAITPAKPRAAPTLRALAAHQRCVMGSPYFSTPRIARLDRTIRACCSYGYPGASGALLRRDSALPGQACRPAPSRSTRPAGPALKRTMRSSRNLHAPEPRARHSTRRSGPALTGSSFSSCRTWSLGRRWGTATRPSAPASAPRTPSGTTGYRTWDCRRPPCRRS